MMFLKRIKSDFRMNYMFYILALFYGFIFSAIQIIGDDISNMNLQLTNSRSVFNMVYQEYFKWSSRVIINVFMYYTESISNKYIFFFGCVTGILVYIMSRVLNLLFNKSNSNNVKVAIVAIIGIYPFSILSSAGWIATMTTYFWPFVFMCISIIPLIKAFSKKRQSVLYNVVCTICLIYAANNEQLLVVLMVVYTFSIFYLKYASKLNRIIIIQYVIILFSFIFVVTTPGNTARSYIEQGNNFPSYATLNLISKFQLGFTSTMYKVVFNPNSLVVLLVILVCVAVNMKESRLFIKFIGTIPLAICLVFGPLNSIFNNIFPELSYISHAVTQSNLMYGLITNNNYADKSILLEYIVLCLFLLTLVFGIYFSFSCIEKRILALEFLIGGMLSRISIGFSPTIWASNDRTFSPLYGCLFLIVIMLLEDILSKETIEARNKTIIMILLFGGFGLLSLTIQILAQ